MSGNLKKTCGMMFCLGLLVSVFPIQTFAQEILPVVDEVQDQMIDEEIVVDEIVVDEILEVEEVTSSEVDEIENLEKVEEIVDSEVVVPKVDEAETIVSEEEIVVEEEEVLESSIECEKEVVEEVVSVDTAKECPIQKQTENDVVNVEASIQSNSYVPIVYPEYSDLGYVGEIEDAILYDHFTTKNYTRFEYAENPFMIGQCTWFAWSRFYQIYGFDSGARGNGKTNALEIVRAHEDLFELSSTPAAGAVFSMEENTLYPEYGHTGFVEAYDGEHVWISEGNVKFGQDEGNIWIHKVKWDEFKAQFPDVVFAVPKVNEEVKECFMDVHKTFLF